jgi:flagellar basal body-associated protein FliL
MGGRIGYIALAVPVVIFTLGVLGLGFWIGWTIFSIKVVPPEPEEKDSEKK